MYKVMILVRTQSPIADEDQVVSARAEALRSELESCARSLAETDSTIRGLVLSQVHKAFAPEDRLAMLIEVWTDADEDQQRLLELCVPSALREREELVVAAVSTTDIVFREVLGRATESSPWKIKLVGTAFRREDFELDAFFDYWTNVHAPIGGNVPGLGGYVVSRVTEVLAGDEGADALLALWYESEDVFDAGQTTPEAVAAWNDVANYAKTTGTFWLMTEHVIMSPPPSGPGILESARG